MKLHNSNTIRILLILPFILLSCEDFVEVEAPDNKLVQEVVFNSDATAESAMTGIYNQLFLAAFSSGQTSSVTLLSGLSADNIRNIYTTNIVRVQFEQNELVPDNENNLNIWSSAYNTIYMTNALLEGLSNSEEISRDLKTRLEGEARFVRAFTYFYLVNLYGDIPIILSTNYRENQLAVRNPIADVYSQITDDLRIAVDLLGINYSSGERTQVNKLAATALLARVYLYLEDWEQAEMLSTKVINETTTYELLNEINDVFLANSKEAIWQISPIGGGGLVTHTNEGNIFIIDPIFSFLAGFQLEEDFADVFEKTDRRFINWIGYHEGKNAHFSHKYKVRNSSDFPIVEYSMVLRLAEQYLIRAEARAGKGDLSGSIEDIDVIRERAGVALISESNPGISQKEILDVILEERRKELFAEWGHRWLDLKRTGRAGEVLGANNPLWKPTDLLYPIPTEERMKNLNLSQNPGY
jgi:hypothetical protein